MIKRKLNKIYKKFYKNNKGKTKRSRYLYGKDIYKKLDNTEKSKIKKWVQIYYPNIEIKRKKYRKISRDFVFSKKYYNCSDDDYFMFDFFHKSNKKRLEFITKIKKRDYIHLLNSDESIKLLKDKYKTYQKLKEFYKREIIKINNDNDYKNFIEFGKKHPKFMKKNNNKSCGKGIELINFTEINKKNFFDNLITIEKGAILEELIIQDDEMKMLHPSSVNTIRIITFLDEDGTVKIKYPFLRIGQNDSIVDNGGAGGIFALIDDKTGKVLTHGVDEKFNWYKIHPNTCKKIKGFQIPAWDEAKEIATKAQLKMKDARLIGWDLAYSNKGWVLVEGNGHTMFIGQQITDQKGKKKAFEEMIHYQDLIKNKKKDVM